MPEDVMLQEAIEAIRRGQRARARDLLARLLKADGKNPEYWLWMSAVVESLQERAYCLQNVLKLDPGNQAAHQGLVLAGALPGQEVMPVAPLRRRWETALETGQSQSGRQQGLRARINPLARILVYTMLGLVVLGLVLGGIFGVGRARQVAMAATKTPGPPPTFTSTPTSLGGRQRPANTPAPTPSGPAPLWSLLQATYTPTPIYVNTPHAISEAYRSGMRAFARQDWPAALQFFEQARQVDRAAADIQFYIGEVYFQMGEFEPAFTAYDAAASTDPAFGPAYLGRALARLALVPLSAADLAGVKADLQAAAERDPNFGEIHLARAAFELAHGEREEALAALQSAEQLLPGSPLIPLYRARLALDLGEPSQALEHARQAYELDRTLLEIYLTLGQAALANAEFSQAVDAIQVFLDRQDQDYDAWLAYGQALSGQSGPAAAWTDFPQPDPKFEAAAALEAFGRALALDDASVETFFYRGLTHLRAGEGQEAVNDLYQARKLAQGRPGGGPGGPLWFEINLGFGRALDAAGRPEDALGIFNSTLAQAGSEIQQAAVYYWRAQTRQKLGDLARAIADWKELSALPEKSVPRRWAVTAARRIASLATPTVTSTATPTAKPSVTPRPSATATDTPKTTSSPPPGPTPRPSATPKLPVLKTPQVSPTAGE
jgi:tetratricopeptide (TPR) repeat protein